MFPPHDVVSQEKSLMPCQSHTLVQFGHAASRVSGRRTLCQSALWLLVSGVLTSRLTASDALGNYAAPLKSRLPAVRCRCLLAYRSAPDSAPSHNHTVTACSGIRGLYHNQGRHCTHARRSGLDAGQVPLASSKPPSRPPYSSLMTSCPPAAVNRRSLPSSTLPTHNVSAQHTRPIPVTSAHTW